MVVDETMGNETRQALREAEELLEKLPPLSPDHETVRTVVVQLRQTLREAHGSTESSRRALTASRNTIEQARKLVADLSRRVHTRAQSAGNGSAAGRRSHTGATTVFVDLDTVLLDIHPGRYGPELTVQADVSTALARLSEVADKVIVVANPRPADGAKALATEHRIEMLRRGLGDAVDRVLVVACEHGEDGSCDCAKPGNGLIRSALAENGFDSYLGWYVGADREGVVAGRTAGLQTIRIGPHGADHLSEVHKPDFEARDLVDAANRILLETLAAD
jgi:D-glycero-D-manno-heptose 1,7-bisphosphate phosphatase